MMSRCLWSVLAFTAMHSTVRCVPILSQCVKNCGPIPFNITCDARRPGITSQMIGGHTTLEIVIAFEGLDAYSHPIHEILWTYKPNTAHGRNVPAGRHWDTYERDIKWDNSVVLRSLTIHVRDPNCHDNGVYYCNVKLLTIKGQYHSLEEKAQLTFSNC